MDYDLSHHLYQTDAWTNDARLPLPPPPPPLPQLLKGEVLSNPWSAAAVRQKPALILLSVPLPLWRFACSSILFVCLLFNALSCFHFLEAALFVVSLIHSQTQRHYIDQEQQRGRHEQLVEKSSSSDIWTKAFTSVYPCSLCFPPLLYQCHLFTSVTMAMRLSSLKQSTNNPHLCNRQVLNELDVRSSANTFRVVDHNNERSLKAFSNIVHG